MEKEEQLNCLQGIKRKGILGHYLLYSKLPKRNPSVMNVSKAASWLLLAESYMYSTIVISEESNGLLKDLIAKKSYRMLLRIMPILFVAIYNARHGIELYLKSLIIIQCNSIELPKKYCTHELGKLYGFLNVGDEQLVALSDIKSLLLAEGKLFENIQQLSSLVEKYESYKFDNLPSLIDADVCEQIDKMNMYFRYPDKVATNETISQKVEDLFSGDLENYIEQNFMELYRMQKLTEEIKQDMKKIIKITHPIGNSIAAYVDADTAKP